MNDKPYQIGLPEGLKIMMVDDYPDLIPIVHIGAPTRLVAFAPDKYDAERLVNALNLANQFEKTWTSLP
jgi:hypothetical protein